MLPDCLSLKNKLRNSLIHKIFCPEFNFKYINELFNYFESFKIILNQKIKIAARWLFFEKNQNKENGFCGHVLWRFRCSSIRISSPFFRRRSLRSSKIRRETPLSIMQDLEKAILLPQVHPLGRFPPFRLSPMW